MTGPEMLCTHGYDASFCAQCKKEELSQESLAWLFPVGLAIFIVGVGGIVGFFIWNPLNWNLF